MSDAKKTGRPARPRIRSFKPERYQDERLAEVGIPARHLYDGLTVQADDSGRLSGNVRLIRANILPFDDVTAEDIAAWLDELEAAGLIARYQADRRTWIAIVSWLEDQKIDRPTPSRLPPPPLGSAAADPEQDPYREEVESGRESSTVPREEVPNVQQGAEREQGADLGRERSSRALARPHHSAYVQEKLAAIAERDGRAAPTADQVDELLAKHPTKDTRRAVNEMAEKHRTDPVRMPLVCLAAYLEQADDESARLARDAERAATADSDHEARMARLRREYPPEPGDADYDEKQARRELESVAA